MNFCSCFSSAFRAQPTTRNAAAVHAISRCFMALSPQGPIGRGYRFVSNLLMPGSITRRFSAVKRSGGSGSPGVSNKTVATLAQIQGWQPSPREGWLWPIRRILVLLHTHSRVFIRRQTYACLRFLSKAMPPKPSSKSVAGSGIRTILASLPI